MSVMLGAFAAHGLRGKIAEPLFNAFVTGVQYQMSHALALLLIGVLMQLFPQNPYLKYSGYLFILGTLLFSGSLYMLALSGIKLFGPLTPLGGVAFIVGWLFLFFACYKSL